MTKSGASLEFVPPGKGPWALDSAHFDRPFPRYARDQFARGFEDGQALWLDRVGIPMKGMRTAFVHGFFYVQIVPLVGKADAGTKLPPRWLFRLVSALHPELRKRARAARSWVEGRGWRDDVRRWDTVTKPGLKVRLAGIDAVQPASLADQALIDHLRDACALMVDNLRAHFDTNPTTIYPVATFVTEVRKWTGATPSEALAVIQTAAGETHGDGALDALAGALHASGMAETLVAGDDARLVLDALRAREDAIGEAARVWLAHVGPRMISMGDLSLPVGAECPLLLLETIQVTVARVARGAERAGNGGAAVAELRARVPAADRARYDELLAEAHLVYRLRDERCTELDCWALGLVRRGLVEAGRRLAERSLLADPAHVVDLEHAELDALLVRGKGLRTEDVAARSATRCAMKVDDAPELLGTTTRDVPPPLDYFDDATGKLLGALFSYADLMDRDAPEPEKPSADLLRGLAASKGKYRGPVRIAIAPEQFANVRPGDVLVVRATMPAYNVLLPIVGAIVTDKGGTLCHAAIVSREYGLPCVVGTRDATNRLRDGDLVEVDGDAGTVEIVR